METTGMSSASDKMLADKAARTKDLILAVVIVLTGIYGSVSISGTSATGLVGVQAMDHTTLPWIWGMMLMLLGTLWAFQILAELMQINKSLKSIDDETSMWSIDRFFPDMSRSLLFRMGVAIIGLIAYAMLFEELPFYLITSVFLFVMLLVFGRPLGLQTALVAISGGVAFHAMFVIFLKLPL